MSSIRLVTEDFSVSPQIALSDLKVAASQGVNNLICHRFNRCGCSDVVNYTSQAFSEHSWI